MRANAKPLSLRINGHEVLVPCGISVAAALALAAPLGLTRHSLQGGSRAPFCGMGVCHECRVEIDGLRMLACQTTCAEGMTIFTDSLKASYGGGSSAHSLRSEA